MSKKNVSQSSAVDIEDVARRAKEASWRLGTLSTESRDRALEEILRCLEESRDAIVDVNREDIADADEMVANGEMSAALRKRLDLSGDKYETILAGIRDLIKLEDPVGRVELARELDDGLELYRVTCPIGVIGVIFESRPDAAVQIATLAIKSGNAVLLKGGRESSRSNSALVEAIRVALERTGDVPPDAVQNLSTREEVRAMLGLSPYIDLIIPRGSNELVQSIQANTRIPVLGHADGICHVYVDESAKCDTAVRVVVDSKVQYPGVCNATETLLVHADAAPTILPALATELIAKGVELRCDDRAAALVSQSSPATEEDWRSEHLDLVLGVKIVDSLVEAVKHINRYGSHHTDAIVTEDTATAQIFMSRVDSAGVYQNASTRFADGFRYGFGAEVGVSTCKTHSRGPVGLDGLVIYKYRLYGAGHRVADYGPGKRQFTHGEIAEGHRKI